MPNERTSLGFPAHSSGIHTEKSGTHSFNNYIIQTFHSCSTRIVSIISTCTRTSPSNCYPAFKGFGKVKVEQNYNSFLHSGQESWEMKWELQGLPPRQQGAGAEISFPLNLLDPSCGIALNATFLGQSLSLCIVCSGILLAGFSWLI